MPHWPLCFASRGERFAWLSGSGQHSQQRAAGGRSSDAFGEEIEKRVDKLEDGGCGTAYLSPQEFVTILKAMILDEDAGWVNRDPPLAKALRLRE